MTDLEQVDYCYMTLHTGEHVEYDLVSRKPQLMMGDGGMRLVPMVLIRKRGNRTDLGGWYRMDALFYVMVDGTTER